MVWTGQKNRLRCENTKVTDILGMTSWRREVSSFVAWIFFVGMVIFVGHVTHVDGKWSVGMVIFCNKLPVGYDWNFFQGVEATLPSDQQPWWFCTVDIYGNTWAPSGYFQKVPPLTVPPLKNGPFAPKGNFIDSNHWNFHREIPLLVLGRVNLAE